MSKLSKSSFATLFLASAMVAAGLPYAAHAQQVEPRTQSLLDGLAGAKPIYTLPVPAARDMLSGAQKSVMGNLAPANFEDRALPVGPSGRTSIRFYRSAWAIAAVGELRGARMRW